MFKHYNLSKRLISIMMTVILMLAVVCTAGAEPSSAATRLKVSPTSRIIYVGGKVQIKANKKVRWSIVNKKTNVKFVSRKSRTCTVKGVKAGTVYVKAKAGRSVKKIRITVRSKVPTSINLESSTGFLYEGEHCIVSVRSTVPSYASKSVTFSSSDESIATVNSEGLVVGVGAGTVTITATSKLNQKVKSSVTIKVTDPLDGTVTMVAGLKNEEQFPAGAETDLWIPIPQNSGKQTISGLSVKGADPSGMTSQLTTDSAGNRAYHIVWDETVEPSARVATVSYHMMRVPVERPDNLENREKGSVDSSAMAAYLRETNLTGPLTSGIVKETADQIVEEAGAETVYQKAYAIYDWACDNLALDKGKTNLGSGDATAVLNHLGENCCGSADVNETFVALCRAEGIPARCNYGLLMSEMSENTYGAKLQGCRAQFNLPGYGWVEADVSAPLKVICGHENNYRGDDAPFKEQWKTQKNKYWAKASKYWLMLSSGSDITLTPAQSAASAETILVNEDGTLAYFAYPYAEYDGQYVLCHDESSLEKSELSYTYSFDKDPDGCGCD